MVPPNGGPVIETGSSATGTSTSLGGWGVTDKRRSPVLDAVVSGERYRLNDIITSDPCCIDQRDEEGSFFPLPLPPPLPVPTWPTFQPKIIFFIFCQLPSAPVVRVRLRARTWLMPHPNRKIHLFSYTGRSAVLLACLNGDIAAAEILVRAGCSLDQKDTDPLRGGRPIHYAAW